MGGVDDSQTGPKPRNHPEYWLFFYSNFTFCVPNLTKTLGWKGGFKDLGKFYQITLRFLDLPLAELSLLETVSDIPAHYENTMKRNLSFLHLTPIRCHIAKKMPGIWLKQCLWVTISLPWTVVGQHLGAGGLPGQRTPRTGASINFLCVDFEQTIMKLERGPIHLWMYTF